MLIIGPEYREGLKAVPIVMTAEIMMGIYFNLSFWYKLIDRTIWGAAFSIAGCLVLIAINVLFIPRYGYMACAWGGFAGYAVAMTLSYFVGQRLNPIAYDLRTITHYVVLTIAMYIAMTCLPSSWPIWLKVILNTGLIAIFIIEIVRRDLHHANLPIIGRYFKK